MPIYVYKCPECKSTQDVDHGMTSSPIIKCEKCDAVCNKVPGVGAVTFRGGGWGSSN